MKDEEEIDIRNMDSIKFTQRLTIEEAKRRYPGASGLKDVVTNELETEKSKLNTDRELFSESESDAYAPSLHVTERGLIGINVGGRVIVRSLREWHRYAANRIDNGESSD